MKATTTIDEAGRLVVPKGIRDQLKLRPGTKLRGALAGDTIEISEQPAEPRISRGKDGMRVIAGWEGFDAAEAVRDARERQIRQLEPPDNG